MNEWGCTKPQLGSIAQFCKFMHITFWVLSFAFSTQEAPGFFSINTDLGKWVLVFFLERVTRDHLPFSSPRFTLETF